MKNLSFFRGNIWWCVSQKLQVVECNRSLSLYIQFCLFLFNFFSLNGLTCLQKIPSVVKIIKYYNPGFNSMKSFVNWIISIVLRWFPNSVNFEKILLIFVWNHTFHWLSYIISKCWWIVRYCCLGFAKPKVH